MTVFTLLPSSFALVANNCNRYYKWKSSMERELLSLSEIIDWLVKVVKMSRLMVALSGRPVSRRERTGESTWSWSFREVTNSALT